MKSFAIAIGSLVAVLIFCAIFCHASIQLGEDNQWLYEQVGYPPVAQEEVSSVSANIGGDAITLGYVVMLIVCCLIFPQLTAEVMRTTEPAIVAIVVVAVITIAVLLFTGVIP